jgi:pre-mRNA-splicing factor CWC22
MIIECCSQERTFSRFYGLMGERFCNLNRNWQESFEQAFETYYTTIHRYETNRLRNIAKFFGYLISSDAIGWQCFSVIHLNEEETTSSSRIFIKILFQDLQEHLGLKKLVERLKDSYLQESFEGIFPRTDPKDIRFSINYFTSIGLGGVTEEMRAALANLPKPAAIVAKEEDESDSESVSSSGSSRSSYSSRSGSYSGSYSSSGSESGSESDSERGRSRSPARRRRYSSEDRSITPTGKAPRRQESQPKRDSPSRRRDSPRGNAKGESSSRRRYSLDESPPPRRPRDDSPPRRRRDSPPRRSPSPRRRQYRDDSPRGDRSPRRYRDESPRRRSNVSPRRREARTPPRRRPSPPGRRDSPRRSRRDSPSPRRRANDSDSEDNSSRSPSVDSRN